MKTACRLALGLLCSLALWSPAHAQVALSPQMADISLDGPSTTHSFRLSNEAKQPMRVAVTVSNWDMDIDGRVRTIPSTAQSLDPWVEINPVTFTVLPGQSQVVRYAIRPAVALTPGEHRAMVFFTEQPGPADPAKPATMQVYFRLGAAIYAHLGPVLENGEITGLKADAHAALFAMHSTGNATTRMRGQYALWSAASYPQQAAISTAQLQPTYQPPPGLLSYGRLPQDAVLPGAERHVTLSFGKVALAPGHYVLHAQGTLGATRIDRTLRFDVAASHGP